MSRILVVDDSADLRDLVRAYLEAAGHTVETAYDGESGVKAALKEPPDLILTDIQMPRLDGFGLFSAVRSHARTAQVPVVMLTAHNSKEMLAKALQAGVDDFLGKPFNSHELLKSVADRLKPAPAGAKAAVAPIRMAAPGAELPAPPKQSVKREVSGSVLVCEVCTAEALAGLLKGEEATELLTRYFTEARQIVELEGGWVVRFMKDRFVAVFDADSQTHIGSHALRASRAALISVLAAQRLKPWISNRFPGRALPEFTVAFGIHTGMVEVYAAVGAAVGKSFGATVRGSTVDIATFLGAASRKLAWSIVASRATATDANFEFVAGRSTGLQLEKDRLPVVEVRGLPGGGDMTPELQRTHALVDAAVERNNTLLASTQLAARRVESTPARPGGPAAAKPGVKPAAKPGAKAAPARPAADHPWGGVEVDGYKISRKLAENGPVLVFLAEPKAGGAPHALKAIRVDDDKKRLDVEQMVEDQATAGAISHPSVARVFRLGVSGLFAYFAMEYCPGGDLRNSIAERMVIEDVMKTLLRLCVGLKAAHEKKVFHGDLKPSNVLIRADGSLAIADFHTATIVETALGGADTGVMVRAPGYISPELINGQAADAQSDLYSLGVVLHEMLTGQRPYVSADLSQVMMQHISAPVPKLPPELERFQPLLEKFMAKKREERFGSVQEAITFMARAKIAVPESPKPVAPA